VITTEAQSPEPRRHKLSRVALVAAVLCGVVSLLLFAGCVALVYDISHGGIAEMWRELEYTVRSPGGTWEVRAYYQNGLGSPSGYVEVVRLADGKTRKLWTGSVLPSAPVWIDDSNVLIGEQSVDVTGPSVYEVDDPNDGFPTPAEAAEQYIRGLAAGDLELVQKASDDIVTQESLLGLQRDAFGANEPLEIIELTLEQDENVVGGPDEDQAAYDVALLVRRAGGETEHLKLTALSLTGWGDKTVWYANYAWLDADAVP
jgi:hypothetical protein